MRESKTTAWNTLAFSGLSPEHPTAPQLYVINIFSFLAFLSLALFGFLQIFAENNPQLGQLELVGSVIFLFNVVLLRFSHNVTWGRDIFLLNVTGFLILMLITGGTQGTGTFWFFVFPVSAFFLAGKRKGLAWMVVLLGTVIAVLTLSQLGLIGIFYTPVTVRQLLVSLAVVAVGIYAYEQARENMQGRMLREEAAIETAKTEFLTLASHQLRTPISAIAWFSEMLLHGDAGKLSEDQRDYIAQIDDSNRRSATIVDAIITVSTLQKGKLHVRLEAVDVAETCRALLQTQFANIQASKSIQLKESYAPKLRKIRCDATLLRTILQNLLSNAFKYTADGGTVSIEVEKVAEKLSPQSQGSIQITVTDTGYGIPKDEQSKIFARLFRASNIKSKDTDGTGLGLYIVKAILEHVGGAVRFVSTEGKGSTFIALLPLEGMHQETLTRKAANV